MKKYKLYFLYLVKTGEVFYIGQTKQSLKTRLRNHIGDAKRDRKNYKSTKIRYLLENNIEFKIEKLLEVDTLEEVLDLERDYINWGRSLFNLTNATDGGEGTPGLVWTREMRRKRSENNPYLGVGGKDHPTSIRVSQHDLSGNFIKEWENQTEAAKALGIRKQGIFKSCKEAVFQSGGFIWRYLDPPKNHPKVFKKVPEDKVRKMRDSGMMIKDIASHFSVCRTTVRRRLKDFEKERILKCL